jgi:hypothetical protein
LKLAGPGASVPADFAARVGLPAGRSLEGFLFPATYTLPADAPADELISRMLQSFSAQVTDQMKADAQAQGLTLYQVVTLASIVEREAAVADERPLIAGVYLNRLRKPMSLDADPTVQYALASKTSAPATWWPPITVEDYRGVVSPYNTYLKPVCARPDCQSRPVVDPGCDLPEIFGVFLLPCDMRRRWAASVCHDAGRTAGQRLPIGAGQRLPVGAKPTPAYKGRPTPARRL